MVDFHTHILPNIDDGSRSVEETFNLIREAKEVGFDSIISTSHYIEDSYEINKAERKTWVNVINDALHQKQIDLNMYLGNEIYISDNMIQLLESEKACTLNDTSYVLFELPFHIKPINLYDVVYELLQYKLIPILAHPERYSFVQQEPEMVVDLIQKGVLMQANYGSFIGQYGEKAQLIVKKFLKSDMIHFLGTDVHKQNTIYPKVPQILLELEKLVGNDKVEQITTINPNLVLVNKKLVIEEPKEVRLSLKDKIILKRK